MWVPGLNRVMVTTRHSSPCKEKRIWAALILTCAFTGRSWRLGVTRSEMLPLAPVDSGGSIQDYVQAEDR